MRSARWQAALGQALDFESATLIQAGQDRQSQPRRHLDYLESLINKRGWSADWIERDTNGNGSSLDGISSWSHEQFPSLPWTESWQEPEADAFADYTVWHAPRLLMLALPRAVRNRLELLVESQPVMAGKLYPLYPDVMDVERMKRIRVMGRLLEKNRV
jgi:hypothetical protein